MKCLQQVFRDSIGCETTCSHANDVAFASHPVCYDENGFCSIPFEDKIQLILTVNTNLLGWQPLLQATDTGVGCVAAFVDSSITSLATCSSSLPKVLLPCSSMPPDESCLSTSEVNSSAICLEFHALSEAHKKWAPERFDSRF